MWEASAREMKALQLSEGWVRGCFLGVAVSKHTLLGSQVGHNIVRDEDERQT